MKRAAKLSIMVLGIMMLVTAVPAFSQLIEYQNILTDGDFSAPPPTTYPTSNAWWEAPPGTWELEGQQGEDNIIILNGYMTMGGQHNITNTVLLPVYLGQYFRPDLDLTFNYQIASDEGGCSFDEVNVSVVQFNSLIGGAPTNQWHLETIPLCTNTNTQNGWQSKSYDFATHPTMQSANWPVFSTIYIALVVTTDSSVTSTFKLDNVALWVPKAP